MRFLISKDQGGSRNSLLNQTVPTKNMNNEKLKSLTTDEIGEQSSGKDADEVQREMLRHGKNDEAADDRDVAGSADIDDTPQGHEEIKTKLKEKSNG